MALKGVVYVLITMTNVNRANWGIIVVVLRALKTLRQSTPKTATFEISCVVVVIFAKPREDSLYVVTFLCKGSCDFVCLVICCCHVVT